jgi:serine protease
MKPTRLSHAMLMSTFGVSTLLFSVAQTASSSILPFAFEPVSSPASEPVQNEVAEIKQLIVKIRQKASAESGRGAMSTAAEAAQIQSKMSAFSSILGSNVTYVRTLGVGAWVVNLSQTVTPAMAKAMSSQIARSDAQVEYAHPNFRLHEQFVPNDPEYIKQWHYFAPTTNAISGINAPAAWDMTRGAGVTVAVVDSGYARNFAGVVHPDLASNYLAGYDFVSDAFLSLDGDGYDGDPLDPGTFSVPSLCVDIPPPPAAAATSTFHGTHVAGTIAALGDNGIGVTGVAFQAKILPTRVIGACGIINLADVADAIYWSAGGSVPNVRPNYTPAKVINLSLRGVEVCSATMQNAISYATQSRGATVIAAAGNDNGMDVATITPANCNGVVAVAALDRLGKRTGYTNIGGGVSLSGPGGVTNNVRTNPNGVYSTVNEGVTTPSSNGYAFYEGTSMAAPHVAGIAALMYSVRPGLTSAEVKNMLRQSVRAFVSGSNCNAGTCGAGMADAGRAVARALTVENNIAFNEGLTGGWFDQSTSGQGFDIEVNPYDQLIFGGWYTYSANGTGAQRWYNLSGAYAQGDRVKSLGIYRYTGGVFNTPTNYQPERVGDATISFQSCGLGTLDYHFYDGRPDGSIALTRLTPDVNCEVIRSGNVPVAHSFSAQGISEGLTANWYNPATAGQGLQVEIMPARNETFTQWFTYSTDTLGNGPDQQRWYTIAGSYAAGSHGLNNVPIYSNNGGNFNALPTTQGVVVGRADLLFHSCLTATLNFRFDDGRTGSIEFDRLTGRDTVLCTP